MTPKDATKTEEENPTPVTDAATILHTKRYNTRPHSAQEIAWWMDQYVQGSIPDYQMAAWLMAVNWRGLNPQETAALTHSMVKSGEQLDWTRASMNLVDKHSTGGVGDKVSLVLAPLVASFGVYVPMMAGRGLGHTGGTIDKLESIPGFQTCFANSKFQDLVQSVGCAIVSASPTMCPADRKLYALRDVTGTVSSLGLITASIMSKKIAEHPQSLVLDVKYGQGSFSETQQDALELALSMIRTGHANGLEPTTAFLTHMDQPIGAKVGNWLEVQECVDILKNQYDPHLCADLIQLITAQAAQMLKQSGAFPDTTTFDEIYKQVIQHLQSGKAYAVFRTMVEAQGGDVSVIDNMDTYPKTSAHAANLVAEQDGYISNINGLLVGRVAVQLGAGRMVNTDPIDFTAGMVFQKKVGDAVSKGDVIAKVYTDRPPSVLNKAIVDLGVAIAYSIEECSPPPIISHFVTFDGAQEFSMPE